MMHLGIWNIEPSCIIITRVTWSAHIRYIWYHKLLVFFCFLGGRGGAHVTKCQPDPKSHCSRRGLNSYAMSLHPLSIESIPRQKKCEKKSILTEILACPVWHLYRCLYQGGMSELRSTGPKLVAVLATRCLYQSSFHVHTTLFSVLWRNWSLGVNILGDIAEIAWASNNCRCTLKN